MKDVSRSVLLAWLAASGLALAQVEESTEVIETKVIREGANGVDETATLTVKRDRWGVNFDLVNDSETEVKVQLRAEVVCTSARGSTSVEGEVSLAAPPHRRALGHSKRVSCSSAFGEGSAASYRVSTVEWLVKPHSGPAPARADGTQGDSSGGHAGAGREEGARGESEVDRPRGEPAAESSPSAGGQARSPGQDGTAREQRSALSSGEAPPQRSTYQEQRSQQTSSTQVQPSRTTQPGAPTAQRRQTSTRSPTPAPSSSSGSRSAGGGLPLPTRLPISSGSSSSGGGKAAGGALLGGGAVAGVTGAAVSAGGAKKPSESQLLYEALQDETGKGRNHWVPGIASLGVVAAGIGLYLIIDAINSSLSLFDPNPSDDDPPTSFGVLPVLFGVDGPAGWWARPSFHFLAGVESLSYQGHYLDAVAQAGANPGLGVSGPLTGHMTGGVARWGLLRASAFLVGAYGKLLDSVESELELLHPGGSNQSFRVPDAEAFLGTDWSVGLQLWQGLLSPYVEYRNVSLQPVQRLGTMQDGNRASNYSYREGVLTLTPAHAFVIGNSFDFSGLFATKGPLRRSLVIDVSVALTTSAPLSPNFRVGLGYTVTWY